MKTLTEAQRKRRHQIVADTIGTARADGVETSAAMRQIMSRWVDGELTMRQVSAEVKKHVEALTADYKARQEAGEVFPPSDGNYIPYEGELDEIVFPNGARRWIPVASNENQG
jgi:hypothetical protein